MSFLQQETLSDNHISTVILGILLFFLLYILWGLFPFAYLFAVNIIAGTKAGGVGQAYQQQSQQGQQLYMTYDPSLQANYLQNTGVLQRGPGGPVQNSVVPALQPSSSYYSGSTGIGKSYNNSWRF